MDEQQQHLRYLIIDDFDQMRVSFKGMLSCYGATDVTTVSSGEKALKLLANNSYDVVICDYNLGEGKDGQQVLEESRHLGYLGHAATFFMITAESNMPMVMSALEHQPDDYMVKPINRDVLHHRLTVALKRKRQLKEIDDALVRDDKLAAIELCRGRSGKDLKQRLYLAKLQAELCLDIKRYSEAEKIFKGILEIRDFPWARFGLCKIRFLSADYESAESGFRELIEQNHLYLEVYDWLVKLLQARDETLEAQRLLQDAVQLSPKAVARQRKLGKLAAVNGDIDGAEKAYQAAIRWGRYSCFAKAIEYRRLAEIYQERGSISKVVRLLVEGRKRFSAQPVERIQMLCGQALSQRRHQGAGAVVDDYLEEVMRLIDTHKKDMTAEHLFTTADECFQLAKHEEAKQLLQILLSNHHDDDKWVERVTELMLRHGRENEVAQLMTIARGELEEIHVKCTELLRNERLQQAITLLNEAIDQYPRNRTLMLMAAGAMINYMHDNGMDQGYHFRCRYSLNRLLERDRQDQDAGRFLKMLNKITPSRVEESVGGQYG
ncbi:MAG: response regulator [Candidatus Thiodiazotropha sp.]|nr:response regulator [Candidatus Thiodiazotropha taylori]